MNSRDCSFRYIVRVKRTGAMTEIPVCQKAFIALHGISKRRLQTIQDSMKDTRKSPKDKEAGTITDHGSYQKQKKTPL